MYPARLDMILGNAVEGISGDMSTVIAECGFWMMMHQTGNLFCIDHSKASHAVNNF